MDATGAENHCTLLVIEPSTLEKDMLWVASDDGRVHYTQNGGQDWIEVTKNIKGLPAGSWIPQIKASNKNKGEALLIANDYRRFNYTPYAYRTTNYGKTWERIVDENDVESYALSIIEDPKNPNLLFLGTDDGLYVSLDAGKQWQKWTEGFPTVSTKDLAIHEREQDLIIGTFGRAAWVLDDIRPLRAIAGNASVLDKEISLFPSPDAYLAAYQQPTGSRFGADAMYHGENKKAGAMITYYLKSVTKPKTDSKDDIKKKAAEKNADSEDADKKKEKTKDSVFFTFYKGDALIRTLKFKTPKKAGFHRIYWNLDEKGADRPSRNISKRKNEPSGASVLPGTYTVKVAYGEMTDETQVVVKPDPRIKTSDKTLNEVYAATKELEGYSQKAADAVKQLNTSKKTANELSKRLSDLDKEKYKDAIKSSKDIVKSIDSVVALYIGKVDKRQGITRNPELTVMQRMGTANYYVQTRQKGITKTETDMIGYLKDDLTNALDKTNTFYTETWKPYQEMIQGLNLSPFKKTEKFRLEDQ
jgi:hypothetical protein